MGLFYHVEFCVIAATKINIDVMTFWILFIELLRFLKSMESLKKLRRFDGMTKLMADRDFNKIIISILNYQLYSCSTYWRKLIKIIQKNYFVIFFRLCLLHFKVLI